MAQTSGDTQVAYCRVHGLSLTSFGYWRRKLAGQAQPASPAVLPIRVTPAVQGASVEVRLQGGIVLSVAAADPAWLASLLRLRPLLSLQSWWLVSAPTDLRCGMDRPLLQVRSVLGRDPAEGEACVFGNRAGSRIKLLCCDRHGVWLAVRRLQQGRFVWAGADEAAWALSAEQFAWLCAGVDWQCLSIGPMSQAGAL